MSTISSTADRRTDAGSNFLTTVAAVTAATKRLWVAYFTWRVEQGAIALLRSMNDQELKDMGLARAEIASVVRGAGAR